MMNWHSRRALSWRVFNTLEKDFSVEALEGVLARYGHRRSSTPTQGAQFIARAFTDVLNGRPVAISIDGKGRWMDDVFIERPWRSVKYEDAYLRASETPAELGAGLTRYFEYYNAKRCHNALEWCTTDAGYRAQAAPVQAD